MSPEGHVISPAGVRFIARFEGFRGNLYNDPLGHCTIGFGHLVHRGNCDGSEPARFKRGITRRRGLKLLRKDITDCLASVNDVVQVALNQQQFDALVSFAYNVGTGAFATSTLVRKLNQGDYQSVRSELMRWTNNGLPGLVNRRRAEAELFEHGTYALHDSFDREADNQIGGPGPGRNAEIVEDAATPDEASAAVEEGPADEGQHAEAGDSPVDVGEPTDEPDIDVSPQAVALPPATVLLKQSMSIAVDMGLLITSTTGPGHGPRSYHYRRPYQHIVVRGRRYEVGRAQDAAKAGNGSPGNLYRRYFRKIEQMKPTELFYDPMGYSWLNGQKVDWTPGDHRDHVHVAF